MHPFAQNSYETARRLGWDDLIQTALPAFTPPLTIHVPIHPPYSRDFVHVEPSLCAVRRRIYLLSPGCETIPLGHPRDCA